MDEKAETRMMLQRQLRAIRELSYTKRANRDRIIRSLFSKYETRKDRREDPEPSEQQLRHIKQTLKLPAVPVIKRRHERVNPFRNLHDKLTSPFLAEDYSSLVSNPERRRLLTVKQLSSRFKEELTELQFQYNRVINQTNRI